MRVCASAACESGITLSTIGAIRPFIKSGHTSRSTARAIAAFSAFARARNVEPVNGGGDWIITRPEHWMFKDTGVQAGDRIPGLIGWEYHGQPAEIPGLEVVATGTAFQGGENPQQWTATIYPGPKGNFVFNAATIFWAQGLSNPPGHVLPWSHWSRPHGPDERVQRITHNLLRQAIGQ